MEVKLDTLSQNGYEWEYAYFEKPNKNGVGVIATENNGSYLVRQYRHASKEFFWQIPLGMIDPNMSPIDAAKQELREEAGISAQDMKEIGIFVPEPGISPQKMHLFVAKKLTPVQRDLSTTEQNMESRFFSFGEIEKMVKSGEITCGFTLSSLMLFRIHFLNKSIF